MHAFFYGVRGPGYWALNACRGRARCRKVRLFFSRAPDMSDMNQEGLLRHALQSAGKLGGSADRDTPLGALLLRAVAAGNASLTRSVLGVIESPGSTNRSRPDFRWIPGGGAVGDSAAPSDGEPLASSTVTFDPPPLCCLCSCGAYAKECLRAAWMEIHSGSWKDVPVWPRRAYAAAALLCVAVDVATASPTTARGSGDDCHTCHERGAAASSQPTHTLCLRQLDVALMLCAPEDRSPLWGAIDMLQRAGRGGSTCDTDDTAGLKTPGGMRDTDDTAPAGREEGQAPASATGGDNDPIGHLGALPLPGTQPVPRVACPSLEAFSRDYMYFGAACTGTGTMSRATAPSNVYDDSGDQRSTGPDARARGSTGVASLGRPVVLTGTIGHWPAVRRWMDPSTGLPAMGYLLRVAGQRTVPVEVGGHYMAEGWGQKLMSLSQFAAAAGLVEAAATDASARGDAGEPAEGSSHGEDAPACGREWLGGGCAAPGTSSPPIAYLAQHPLFDQIPALAHDIATPDYCALAPPLPFDGRPGQQGDAENEGASEPPCWKRARRSDQPASSSHETLYSESLEDEPPASVAVNAWFGPRGTVSVMHWDAPCNLLCQVVGVKRVLLVDPRAPAHAVVPCGGLMGNTARADPEEALACRLKGHGLKAPAAVGSSGDWHRLDDGASHDEHDAFFPSPPSPASGLVLNGLQQHQCSTAEPSPSCALASSGTPIYCAVLGPGDVLYIPPKWWHHVRAIAPSFSVSFWWGAAYT